MKTKEKDFFDKLNDFVNQRTKEMIEDLRKNKLKYTRERDYPNPAWFEDSEYDKM